MNCRAKAAVPALLVLFTACAGAGGGPGGPPAQPPNIVFLLVDDLGAMDVGAFNPDTFYEPPNIDRLAAGGVRFTRGYAANPVCSPTRYSIMTGRYPTRVGATNYFAGRRQEKYAPAPLNDRMPLTEYTLAEALRDGGYRTAFLGKWHLGTTEEFWPLAQGFDVNVGGHRGGMPRSYFSPYSNPTLEDGPEDEHLTARLTDEALDLIDGYATDEEGRPFLLYLAYYAVHTPLQAPAELVAKYAEKAGVEVGAPADPANFGDEEQVWPRDEPRRVREVQNHAVYAAMVETLDASVGRILDRLDALDLAENTIVVFFSDNGGLSTAEGAPTSNLPFRGGKGWLYEGGIREPMIVRWPAAERDLFWHYPHYGNQGGFPGGAISQGRYKLIERYEDGRVHLYDLEGDVGERNDLAAEQPERVAEMRARLHAWYDEVGAQFLSALPDGPEPWQPPVRSASGP